jgi:hypothetical protein
MAHTIEIKKLELIKGANHLIDIYNHYLVVYLKHYDTIIRAEYITDPVNELTEGIARIKEGVDITFTTNTYQIT